MHKPKSEQIRDTEIFVWALSEDRARQFVGVLENAKVRYVETEARPPETVDPKCNLYAVNVE